MRMEGKTTDDFERLESVQGGDDEEFWTGGNADADDEQDTAYDGLGSNMGYSLMKRQTFTPPFMRSLRQKKYSNK